MAFTSSLLPQIGDILSATPESFQHGVPHAICIYRVCLCDKTTQGTSLRGNWDCRHLASLMSAIQH